MYFMDSKYLLTTPMAERLYYCIAADLPLIDYHNHLNVKDLSCDRSFSNIAEAWLLGDPYKHRAMRICGVDETLITGEVSDREKFMAWCATYPKLIGGPLYDWSAMEMEKLFGIASQINPDNAGRIWDEANEKLRSPEFTALGIYRHFNVKYAAPCASLTEDLKQFSGVEGLAPSLRGDDIVCPSAVLLDKLEAMTGVKINDAESLEAAIGARLDAFAAAGCCFSDHALDNGFEYFRDDGKTTSRISAAVKGAVFEGNEKAALISGMLRMLARQYAARGWTMQLHIGAQRFTSSKLRLAAGGAGGFAGIGKCVDVSSLTSMLDDFEMSEAGLPKVILYTLNPADNAVMAVLSGSFRGVTQGPAWWWCDHLQGMREMLDTFSTFSVLSTFPGMTTDSRSLLSLLRHDYFRRAFCGWAGEKAARGELPDDYEVLAALTKAVCFENADSLIR